MNSSTVPPSPNAVKVKALIEHLGVEVEGVAVDRTRGEDVAPDFLAVNPNGEVPDLVDGDFRLRESNAILQYLAEKHGATEPWPGDVRGRAHVARWQCWEASHRVQAPGTFLHERLVKAWE